jgi:hypothetical protein
VRRSEALHNDEIILLHRALLSASASWHFSRLNAVKERQIQEGADRSTVYRSVPLICLTFNLTVCSQVYDMSSVRSLVKINFRWKVTSMGSSLGIVER